MKTGLIAITVACVAWGQDSFGLRFTGALGRAKTDERIQTYERLLASSPDDFRLQSGLISAYLQKLRESADRTYLDRASKLVDGMLEKDGGNFSALRFENEIDLQRHEFKALPNAPRTWRSILLRTPAIGATWAMR